MSKKAAKAESQDTHKCQCNCNGHHDDSPADWRAMLAEALPMLGHRNWIAIVDSAYPAQTRDGIDMIPVEAGQLEIVKIVLAAVDQARHLRPIIYMDAELRHIPERHAKGIAAYRRGLARLLKGRTVNELPHEQIIGELDQAAKLFQILVLKSTLTLPYTSVFVQLDCGYWTEQAEKELREALRKASARAADTGE
ncbi:MAG TPA: hypothetical protein VGP72_09065 [Planctomycetota bacterium]|jgi:D-ribose pyranose/furanose isomerase RbsD